MATTTPSSRLDHLKICMDCSGEGTRHVTDSGKGSLPIRRTVTCARCDGEGLIYVGPEEGREEALRRLILLNGTTSMDVLSVLTRTVRRTACRCARRTCGLPARHREFSHQRR